jgi:hypothetical protein
MRKDYGLAPYAYLSGEKQISEKVFIQVGAGYSILNAVNTRKSVLLNEYSFGRDTNSFTANFTRYTYCYGFAQLRYMFSSTIGVYGGGGASFMLDSRAQLYDKIYGARYANGYGIGFARTDAFANFGIYCQASSRIALEAQYQKGFIDITNNTYFANAVQDKQQRVMVGLRYTLTKKRW